ncbi:hypothetical protein N7447_003748 [Penicillium robsamsonii]|uniref:uncharacterized protein n=1 Tax=Penicillium robsamsonii TaxID=1792511 RepID=UPI002546DC4D|nr:uncharacterized protein N7447_003748 [Penicillium robsamsonii]KAJ5826985.1 hypothetical protein N7447_003748 [Penicillium robsamsonii]
MVETSRTLPLPRIGTPAIQSSRHCPDQSYDIETLRTLSDRGQLTARCDFDGKSLWTAELEEKLVSGELDVIICQPRLTPVSSRQFRTGRSPGRTDRKALPRLGVRPNFAVPTPIFALISANVGTRLAKVDNPDSGYTCMIMSVAGLERVGLKYRINQ